MSRPIESQSETRLFKPASPQPSLNWDEVFETRGLKRMQSSSGLWVIVSNAPVRDDDRLGVDIRPEGDKSRWLNATLSAARVARFDVRTRVDNTYHPALRAEEFTREFLSRTDARTVHSHWYSEEDPQFADANYMAYWVNLRLTGDKVLAAESTWHGKLYTSLGFRPTQITDNLKDRRGQRFISVFFER